MRAYQKKITMEGIKVTKETKQQKQFVSVHFLSFLAKILTMTRNYFKEPFTQCSFQAWFVFIRYKNIRVTLCIDFCIATKLPFLILRKRLEQYTLLITFGVVHFHLRSDDVLSIQVNADYSLVIFYVKRVGAPIFWI